MWKQLVVKSTPSPKRTAFHSGVNIGIYYISKCSVVFITGLSFHRAAVKPALSSNDVCSKNVGVSRVHLAKLDFAVVSKALRDVLRHILASPAHFHFPIVRVLGWAEALKLPSPSYFYVLPPSVPPSHPPYPSFFTMPCCRWKTSFYQNTYKTLEA